MEIINTIDLSILNWIQNVLRCDVLDCIMGFFSRIGDAGLVWIVAAIVMLFFKKTRVGGVIMLAAMALGFLLGDICLKPLVARVRPCLVTDIVMNIPKPDSFSFPSGHSTAGFAASVTLLIKNKKLGIAALVLAVLIAFSRLYNYVHYPSDVLCGMILGTLCALLMVYLFNKTGAERKLSGNPN